MTLGAAFPSMKWVYILPQSCGFQPISLLPTPGKSLLDSELCPVPQFGHSSSQIPCKLAMDPDLEPLGCSNIAYLQRQRQEAGLSLSLPRGEGHTPGNGVLPVDPVPSSPCSFQTQASVSPVTATSRSVSPLLSGLQPHPSPPCTRCAAPRAGEQGRSQHKGPAAQRGFPESFTPGLYLTPLICDSSLYWPVDS